MTRSYPLKKLENFVIFTYRISVLTFTFFLLNVPWGDQLRDVLRRRILNLLIREIEQGRQRISIGQPRLLVSQLIEERVLERLNWCHTSLGVIHKQPVDQVDCISRGAWSKHLLPGMSLNLRELELAVVRVHRVNHFSSRCAQNFNNFDQLVHTWLSWEQGLAQQQLGHNATNRPHINRIVVLSRPKNKLWCPVVPRTDVRHIHFSLNESLGGAKVTNL